MILDRDAFGLWSFLAKRVFRAVFTATSSEECAKAIRETLSEREVAMYIHIPFCTGTCVFCPYPRIAVPRSELDRVLDKYFSALITEVKLYGKLLRDLGLRVVDIHAGGGTPSLVPGRLWRLLLEAISEEFEAEPRIAIEANPEDLSAEPKAFDLVDSGVEEVSLGVQSLNPRILKVLGRRHSVEDSIKAIENLRRAGCRYLNIDLMYMVPGQTLGDWVRDLEEASSLDVDEITCYPTLVARHSIGYRLIREGKLPPQPSERDFESMIYACEDTLPKRGYRGVEIYGYSRLEWKYATVNYEMEGPLLAFGAGAVGFTGGFEYVNTHFVEEYVEALKSGRLPIAGARRVRSFERWVRYATCRLFVCRSLDRESFERKFGIEFDEAMRKSGFAAFLKLLKALKRVEDDGRRLYLTRRGLLTAHKVCWAFVLNVPCRIVEEFSREPWPPRVEIP